jgi:hypothetical protein
VEPGDIPEDRGIRFAGADRFEAIPALGLISAGELVFDFPVSEIRVGLFSGGAGVRRALGHLCSSLCGVRTETAETALYRQKSGARSRNKKAHQEAC